MTLRLLSMLFIPLTSMAQQTIPFAISATPCNLCSVYNEHLQWMVSAEPEGNCEFDFTPCVDIPEFTPVEGGDGTTYLDYNATQRGKHHLLLVEKESGRELAYVIIYIDYHMMDYYGGVPLKVFEESRRLSADEPGDWKAIWAPTKKNNVPGLFEPGLLVPFKDWPGRIEVIRFTD